MNDNPIRIHNPPQRRSHESPPDPNAISPHKILTGASVVLLILAVLAVTGILRRMHAHTVLKERTYDLAAPTVTLAPARPGAPVDTFVLPGNVTAYTDAPIYARTDGYLVHWYYDIGTHVKKGALLATIDTPELDQTGGAGRGRPGHRANQCRQRQGAGRSLLGTGQIRCRIADRHRHLQHAGCGHCFCSQVCRRPTCSG